MANDVLDHDDGAVDDHAEVECAEGEQVRGDVARSRQMAANMQREGNGERNDDGAAHIAEEQEKDDDDQDHALGEVMYDSLDREMDEVGAIEKGNYLDAGGQDAVQACR